MNYFEHHVGDYDSATAHLSWLEDCAYRRLICLYYRTEAPITSDLRQVFRLLRATSKAERDAIEQVLSEFFELQDDGYHQHRCDDEIARFEQKSEKARRSAQARWSAPGTHSERNANASPNAMRTHSEGNADGMHRAPVPTTHYPLPNTQETPPTPSRGPGRVAGFPPGFEAFWQAYPRKEGKASAAKAFARLKPSEALQATLIRAVEAQRQSLQWARDGGQYVPHAATWLNGRRWEDSAGTGSTEPDIFAGAI